MAPLEDLQARDLAWISDFIMQQMVIMMRPVIDHLHQTDAAVDYAQRVTQRLSMDISEVRGDVERTNKYVTILRQGLGVQNEGKCVLQRGLEGTTRTVKRLDDQMEGALGVMRGVEDCVAQLCRDVRAVEAKQEELSQHTGASAESVEERVERIGSDVLALKEHMLDSEAKVEACQRELRELRRGGPGILSDKSGRVLHSSHAQGGREHWPQKKAPFTTTVDDKGSLSFPDTSNRSSSSSQHTKRSGRLATKAGMLQQVWSGDGVERDGETASHAGDEAPFLSQPGAHEVHSRLVALEERLSAAWEQLQASRDANHGDAARLEKRLEAHGGELAGLRRAVGELAGEAQASSKLPLLGAKQGAGASRPDRSSGDAPRLRFTATMASPPERRGSPA